jgi:hypothetical protein
MSPGARRLVALLVLAVGLSGLVIQFANGLDGEDLLVLPAVLPMLFVGALLVLRVPESPLSWMLRS